MTRTFLRRSLRLWQRRERYRKQRHTYWQALYMEAREEDAHPRGHLRTKRDKWSRLLDEARQKIARRQRQLEELEAPRVLSARSIGLSFENRFGGLGRERWVTGHHTAGPKDTSLDHAVSLCRQYHRDHKSKGWGGIGYHYSIARSGEIVCLRPVTLKGAHVGGWNSNNVGVMFHGTTGDHPTKAQRRSYAWLLKHAHTSKFPRPHRTDVNLSRVPRRGHNDWPGHGSNACPGTHKPMILNGR